MHHCFLLGHSFDKGTPIGRAGSVKPSTHDPRHARRSPRRPISLGLPGYGSRSPLSPGGMRSRPWRCPTLTNSRSPFLKFCSFLSGKCHALLVVSLGSRDPEAPRMFYFSASAPDTKYVTLHPLLPISEPRPCLLLRLNDEA